jgi:hypothetical protein
MMSICLMIEIHTALSFERIAVLGKKLGILSGSAES